MKIGSTPAKVSVPEFEFTEQEYLALFQQAIAAGCPLDDYVSLGVRLALYRAKYEYEVMTVKRKEEAIQKRHEMLCINAQQNTAGIGRKRRKFGEKVKVLPRSQWGLTVADEKGKREEESLNTVLHGGMKTERKSKQKQDQESMS